MKEVLIILDGLMEKALEGFDLKELLLGNIKENVSIEEGDFFVENRDLDSLNCIMNMLGYSSLKEDIGDRAYYEGLSRGIGDYKYILRCNIVREENGCVKDFTGGELPQNIKEILENISIENGYICPCYEYKNLLVIKSSSEDILNTKFYPPHFHINKPIKDILPKSDIIKSFIHNSHSVFESFGEKGLMLWPWGPTKKVSLECFTNKHGKTAGLVSGIDLVNGIGKALNLKAVMPKGCTGDSDTSLENKLNESINLIREVDILIVHINGFDELSHRKDFNGKIEFTKKVRDSFIRPLIKVLKIYEDCIITITCDHRSDSFTGCHEKGKVPIIEIH